MKKIIKIICILLAFNFFSVSSNSEIKDSLFATVGNKAITESDIKNEIKQEDKKLYSVLHKYSKDLCLEIKPNQGSEKI